MSQLEKSLSPQKKHFCSVTGLLLNQRCKNPKYFYYLRVILLQSCSGGHTNGKNKPISRTFPVSDPGTGSQKVLGQQEPPTQGSSPSLGGTSPSCRRAVPANHFILLCLIMQIPAPRSHFASSPPPCSLCSALLANGFSWSHEQL